MASAATPEEPPEEPPTKKISNDFNLCLKCQGEMRINADNQMNYPKRESYQKFIEYTKERAGYGNPDFVLLNQRLHGLSAEMLEQNRAVWHRACYSEVTHRVHTDRDKYCLTAPELARLATEMEHLSTVPNKTVGQQHHCLSQAKVRRQEYAIAQLKRVLVKCNIFHVSSSESDSQSDSMTSDMYKLLSKEILPANVRDSILSTVQVGQAAYLRFIEERLTGNDNLWAKMTKVKLLSWSTSAKEIKLKVGSEVMTMKATTSLFARMLVIARSSRDDIDLEEVIGTHEFAYTNRVLMEPDGSIHHTTDKSTVIHLLEEMVKVDGEIFQETIHITENDSYCLIVDGMAVLQELMAVKNFKNCKDLGTSYVQLIDSKSLGYYQVRVIFDNYTKANSLKEGTRERRRGNSKGIRSYKVEHSTVIRDKNTFLSSNSTKDSLTMYLAQQLIDGSTLNNLVTVTCRGVMTNSNCSVMTGVSTQEEADTLMIMHAVEVAKTGLRIHIYSQDTDVLLLALRRVQQLGTEPAIIMGTKERRRKVHLQPIYDKLGPDKAAALINWHALTGCDTTGHIQGKGKKGCFTAFLASSSTVIAALNGLGEGPEPSDEVVKGCEEFLCSLFCPKRLHITQANNLEMAPLQTTEDGSRSGQTTTNPWCLVRTHQASTCTS